MQSAIKLTARVLPGKRIEFTPSELTEGEDVEIFVALPVEHSSSASEDGRKQGVWDFIRSLEPKQLTPSEWEQIEREFREERDAWDD